MKNEEEISKLNGERVEGGKNMRSTMNMIIIYFVKFQIIKNNSNKLKTYLISQ